MNTPTNIVVTGIPRSGTTLICHLLNKLPNTVALHEPMDVRGLAALPDRSRVAGEVQRFFDETRLGLLSDGTAPSKQVDGAVPDNPVGGPAGGVGIRARRVTKGRIVVDKPLTDEFSLCIKHPAAFTALLHDLAPRFLTIAVVRNPVSVLASWSSVPFPVRDGRAPAAERFDARLAAELASITDRVDRQIHLLSWFFARYDAVLPRDRVIHYEDVVATGGRVLERVIPQAAWLNERLESKNKNPLYDHETFESLGRRLLAVDGAFWKFYPRESVEQLLDCVRIPNG
jgi:hypothetical protein